MDLQKEAQRIVDAAVADGSEQTIPIRSRVDVNDWWNPVALAHAWPLWQGENDSARIGLYASSYPLTGRAPRSATLRVTDNRALWMIPAITLTGEPVRFAVTEDKEWKLAAGKEWIPVEFRRDTVRGSALDFSFLAGGCIILVLVIVGIIFKAQKPEEDEELEAVKKRIEEGSE